MITSIALFMVSLDNLVVSTAIPVIRVDLHASLESLSWTVNAYTLTFAVLLLTGAALGDRFGRRRMFAIGVGIFTARLGRRRARAERRGAQHRPRRAGARRRDRDAADADDPLGRRPAREARARARRAGARSAASRSRSAPSSAAPSSRASRGSTSSGSTSRSGSCSCRSRSRRLTESHGPAGKLDLPGVGLVSAGMFGIVWGLIRGNELGWTSPEILAALGLGVALVAAFVAWELRAPAPDAADDVLPQRGVLAREPRLAVHVLRDVRLDLPADAVLPDRAGLLAAQLGAADPAVDARADVRRPVRGRDVRPGQPEADPQHRA